jgi:hypothetical protein
MKDRAENKDAFVAISNQNEYEAIRKLFDKTIVQTFHKKIGNDN